MKRTHTYIIFLSSIIVLNSCATILNSKKTNLKVLTSEPSQLIVNNDTLNDLSTEKTISVLRSIEPLEVTVFNDDVSKTVNIKSQNSLAYYLNIYPGWHFWTGFLIDRNSNKRYTYPLHVFIDFSETGQSYLNYKPLEKPLDQYTDILKITPLKLVGFINPGIELSYERRTSDRFSTQLTASYQLPDKIWKDNYDFKPEISGYRIALEERLYLKKTAPIGPYASLEVNYLNNKYKSNERFINGDLSIDSLSYEFTYSEVLRVKKQTVSFNLKLGYQFIYKRLSFDFYAGFGMKYKDVKLFDRSRPNDDRYNHIFSINYHTNNPGKYWAVSIPLNARIGWTF